jgi:uncharacterized protein (TIGR00297 family)
MNRRRLAFSLALSGAIGVVGRRRRALSRSGVLGSVLVGSPVFYGGGARWATVLLTFFGSSSALSRIKGRARQHPAQPAIEARGSERDVVQALANGGVAAAVAVSRRLLPMSVAEHAFAGSLAAANADTWATEIGKMGRKPPRMILSGATVAPGTSGAVSAHGLAASVCGSALIGAVTAIGCRPARGGRTFVAITFSGVFGALADSVAGATIQAIYRCPACDQLTERRIHACGAATVLHSGNRWCNNDAVNLICTGAGALAAAALAWPETQARHTACAQKGRCPGTSLPRSAPD